jgi:hypothetical protein
MAADRCPMCGNLGWVTDCNDLNKPGPRMVEFLPCFYPTCEVSGQPIQSLNFTGVRFQHVSKHPREGWVMAVSNPITEERP